MAKNKQSSKVNVSSDIRVGYFTVKTQSGNAYVCVALKRPPKGSSSTHYSAGFDFCSWKDTFIKQRAYTTAIKRLSRCAEPENRKHRVNEGHIVPFIEFHSADKFSSKTFAKALLIAVSRGNVPGWLIRAAKRKDIYYGVNKVSPENSVNYFNAVAVGVSEKSEPVNI